MPQSFLRKAAALLILKSTNLKVRTLRTSKKLSISLGFRQAQSQESQGSLTSSRCLIFKVRFCPIAIGDGTVL